MDQAVDPKSILERRRGAFRAQMIRAGKDMMDDANAMRVSIKSFMISIAHSQNEEHPPENFRGCTHPECVELRKYFKEQGL